MTMKSLRDSFKASRSVPSISSVPKSAVPFVEYCEENELLNLWMDVSKSEDGFRRLLNEAEKYQEALKDTHDTEMKLMSILGEAKIGAYSLTLSNVNDEYLSVVMKTKPLLDELITTIHEVMEVSPSQYHAIYEHLETHSKKRDALISDINKCQEKFDKMKLKGKRTTDLLVEKEKMIRQLKVLNARLVLDLRKFHEARIPFLRLCLNAAVIAQINYYGHVANEFNSCVQQSRRTLQIKEAQYDQIMNEHLKKIQDLKIVD